MFLITGQIGGEKRMNLLKLIVLSMLAIGLIASLGFAGTMEGNAEKGKALFNEPKAFGGSTSCSSCKTSSIIPEQRQLIFPKRIL